MASMGDRNISQPQLADGEVDLCSGDGLPSLFALCAFVLR
jgi:hypothetical protein